MALAVSSLTSGVGNGASANTGSVSPSANSLLTLGVAYAVSGGTTITGVASAGLTLSKAWAKTATVTISSSTKVDLWTAVTGASPGSGAITITAGTTGVSMAWDVDQATGVNTTAPLVSATTVTANGTSASNPSVTYPQAASTGDLFMFFAGAAGFVTQTPHSLWTELADQAESGPSVSIETQVSPLPPGGTTGSSTLSTGVAWGAIGIEVCITPSSTYQQTILGDAPVAYYRLDEQSGTIVNDFSGNGQTGSLGASTGVTQAEASLLLSDTDDCYKFTVGSFNGVQIANSTVFNVGDTFSLEAWIELSALGNNTSIFSLGGNAGYMRVSSDNKLHLLKSQVADMVASTVTLTTGTVYHVVATKNGSTVKLYVNGTDVTGSVSNATCANSANPKSIGGTDAGFAMGFPGFIDEMAVYGVALSPTQVTAHYNAGTATSLGGTGAGAFTFAGSATGTVLYTGTATGSFMFSGSSTGHLVYHATGAGTYLFSGVGTGTSSTINATGAGSYSFTGHGVGLVKYHATAAASFVFGGLATTATPIVEDVTVIPGTYDTTIIQATTWDTPFVFYQDAAETMPVDFTGYSAALTIGAPVNITLASGSAGLTLGTTNGTITPLLTPTQTNLTPGTRAGWALILTDPSGRVYCFSRGVFVWESQCPTP